MGDSYVDSTRLGRGYIALRYNQAQARPRTTTEKSVALVKPIKVVTIMDEEDEGSSPELNRRKRKNKLVERLSSTGDNSVSECLPPGRRFSCVLTPVSGLLTTNCFVIN